MKQKKYTSFLVICMVLFSASSQLLVSQGTDNPGIPQVSAGDKDVVTHSLYAGPGFTSNMNYLGATLSQDKPSFSLSAVYGFREALYLSLAANHLSAFDRLLTFSTASLGYYHDFSSWFDISVNLSGYMVNSKLTDTLFSSFMSGTVSGGLDWRLLYTNISLTTVFSESVDNYFQIRNSRYFIIKSIFGSDANISIDPYISLMLGTMIKTETADGTVIGVSVPFKSPRSPGQGTNNTSTFIGLIEADLGIPVGIDSGKFYIEAEPGYIIPAYEDQNLQSAQGFSLYLSIYYRIF